MSWPSDHTEDQPQAEQKPASVFQWRTPFGMTIQSRMATFREAAKPSCALPDFVATSRKVEIVKLFEHQSLPLQPDNRQQQRVIAPGRWGGDALLVAGQRADGDQWLITQGFVGLGLAASQGIVRKAAPTADIDL